MFTLYISALVGFIRKLVMSVYGYEQDNLLKFLLCLILFIYRGADKSLARPGRKQSRKHVRGARDFNNNETRAVIKFFSPCKASRRKKFTPF